MLKVLFPRSFRLYESSRSGAELAAFAEWLQETGYVRAVIRRHVRRLRHVSEACVTLQCGRTLDETELRKAFALVPCSQPDASTEHAYRQFLRAKGRLGGIRSDRAGRAVAAAISPLSRGCEGVGSGDDRTASGDH